MPITAKSVVAGAKESLHRLRTLPTRTIIAIFKGFLAYMILVIMVMSETVRGAWSYPIVLTSATVVVIAGFPGANVGQTAVSSLLGLVGVGLGAVAFVVLAKLAHAPVGQGIVFVIFVYLFSLLKAKSMMFFGLSLLGILVTFAGLYTSLALPGKVFDPSYLEDYLKAYTLGGAIVFAVNWLILPISSEKELRRTLVMSLGHVKTFSHLIAKSYTMQITEEEKSVRDGLAQSIRADFATLQTKLGTTSLEVNYSKFGMDDYRQMIKATHQLQQDLIGGYSTIVAQERGRKEGHYDHQLFCSVFLPSAAESFLDLRREAAQTIREICAVLGDGITVQELPESEDYRFGDGDDGSSDSGDGSTTMYGSENGKRDLEGGKVGSENAQEGLNQPPTDSPGIAPRGRSNTTRSNFPKMHRKHSDQVSKPLNSGLKRQLDQEAGMAPTPIRGRSRSPTGMRQGTTVQEEFVVGAEEAPPEEVTASARLPRTAAFSAVDGGQTPSRQIVSSGTRWTEPSPNHPVLRAYLHFRDQQQRLIGNMLISGEIKPSDDVLRVSLPQRSLAEIHSVKQLRRQRLDVELSNRKRGRVVGAEQPGKHSKVPEYAAASSALNEAQLGELKEELREDEEDLRGAEGVLLAVTSFMFQMGEFARDLAAMKQHVQFIDKCNRKKLHFHILEKEKKRRPHPSTVDSAKGGMPAEGSAERGPQYADEDEDLPMHVALALLEGRTPIKPKADTWATRLVALENMVRSDESLGALKTAAAAVTFATLLLAPSSRSFFIEYSLTGGVLSVVVAMSPSLGQTLFTFRNQVIGTVSGSIYGMVLLYIFHNVGGYKWNPYGITCLLIPFAIGMMYLIYTKPPLFALGLLALNSANSVIFTEVAYAKVPTFKDSPALRAGKSLVAMCIALAIAFSFQYLINRAPARKLLRKSTADLMSTITAYHVLHSAFCSALNAEPETINHKAPPEWVIRAVNRELGKRERLIQAKLINLYPLISFASLEPEFTGVFRVDLYRTIAGQSQLLLDRMREARVLLGSIGEDASVMSPATFSTLPIFSDMAPYRRFHNRLTRHRLYILSTALQSKSPLPQDSLKTRFVPIGQVQHDALVLTSRLAQSVEGREVINSLTFLKVWSYLLCATTWRNQLDAIEDAIGDLLGVLEDDELL